MLAYISWLDSRLYTANVIGSNPVVSIFFYRLQKRALSSTWIASFITRKENPWGARVCHKHSTLPEHANRQHK